LATADINNRVVIVQFVKDGNTVGYVRTINDNELTIDSLMRDPPKQRVSIHEDLVESNVGGFSANRLRDDGQHHEDGLLMFRLTSDRRGGAFYIAVRPKGSDHADVQEVMYGDLEGVHFRVPVFAPNLGGGGGISSFLRSPNGRYELELQDDGNFVIYDEATHTPIFDSVSTLSRLAALERKVGL
jgi:hypothetical protein